MNLMKHHRTFFLQHLFHKFVLFFLPVTEPQLDSCQSLHNTDAHELSVLDYLCLSSSMLLTIWLRCSMMVTSSAISSCSRLLSSSVQSFSDEKKEEMEEAEHD